METGLETTMISKSKQYLFFLYLIGVTNTVNSVPVYKMAQVDKSMSGQSGCSFDSHNTSDQFPPSATPPVSALVAFVHGGVFDQKGLPIKAGSELAVEDIVTVSSDGFLALQLSDERTLNIQPDTLTSIACALASKTGTLTVNEPYRVGAIRG